MKTIAKIMKHKNLMRFLAVLTAVLFIGGVILAVVFSCVRNENTAFADSNISLQADLPDNLSGAEIDNITGNYVFPSGAYIFKSEFSPFNFTSYVFFETPFYIVYSNNGGSFSDAMLFNKLGFQGVRLYAENDDGKMFLSNANNTWSFVFSRILFFPSIIEVPFTLAGGQSKWLYDNLINLNYFDDLVGSGGNSEGSYNDGYTDGYNQGFDDGYNEGFNAGYQDGLNDNDAYNKGFTNGKNEGIQQGIGQGIQQGYDNGYNVGYGEGYNKAQSDKLVNPVSLLLQPVYDFMNAKLFGEVSIGMFLNAVLFVSLALVFIKMFAGG